MIKILIYFRNIRHSDFRNYEVTVIFCDVILLFNSRLHLSHIDIKNKLK